MPQHQVTVRCPVPSSFAVDQVRGMFDLARATEATETFNVELPTPEDLIDGKPWQIGVIVGPSGSGKSTVARDVYGEAFIERCEWEPTKSVVDHFPGLDMKVVTGTLNAVGFSSPPAWVKPHHVLSGGERFRCDLARALLLPPRNLGKGGGADNLIAFDEFTSVVDRTVAKIGSAAIAKSIRSGRIAKQFVAVTCHYDVLDWLEPDWVLDMASMQLARGSLYRRPKIELEVAPVHRSAWNLFRRHHYLSHGLMPAARCFVAFWPQPGGTSEPVAFSSWVPRMTRGRVDHDMREHRTVVLPDFQGVGIGNRMSEVCASIWPGLGGRAFSTTSHPAMIGYRHNSPKWRTLRHGMVAGSRASNLLKKKKLSAIEQSRLKTMLKNGKQAMSSVGRITGGFQYIGPPMDKQIADKLAGEFPRRHILRAFPNGATTLEALARRSGYSTTCVGSLLTRFIIDGLVVRHPLGGAQFMYERTAAGHHALR